MTTGCDCAHGPRIEIPDLAGVITLTRRRLARASKWAEAILDGMATEDVPACGGVPGVTLAENQCGALLADLLFSTLAATMWLQAHLERVANSKGIDPARWQQTEADSVEALDWLTGPLPVGERLQHAGTALRQAQARMDAYARARMALNQAAPDQTP